ncbi:capsid assembly scaffolding protein Gp46 family protein [Salicibibacter halophilus]|nr:DUF4355 domain-containing protein [Salicibibacter halophilus]
MDLQFFNEGNQGDQGDQGQGDQGQGQQDDQKGAQGDSGQGKGEIFYSQSELDSAISKAVESALEKKQREFDKEKERIEQQAREQGEEYAQMNEKEKKEAEYKERLEKLENRENELNRKQLYNEVQSDLKDNGLPNSFADSLVALNDNDEIKKSIKAIKEKFDEAVTEGVKEQLRQTTPKDTSGNTESSNPFAKETLNLTEQGRLFKEEPERARQLQQAARR